MLKLDANKNSSYVAANKRCEITGRFILYDFQPSRHKLLLWLSFSVLTGGYQLLLAQYCSAVHFNKRCDKMTNWNSRVALRQSGHCQPQVPIWSVFNRNTFLSKKKVMNTDDQPGCLLGACWVAEVCRNSVNFAAVYIRWKQVKVTTGT
jgi:hypothetical protein